MTLYDIIIEVAKKGAFININLDKKDLKIGKTTIIQNKEILNNDFAYDGKSYVFKDLISEKKDLDDLYFIYKHSMPTKQENCKHYFKALTLEELIKNKTLLPENRYIARIALEAYVLLGSITGLIKMPENQWFLKGKDKDFVLLRKHL